MSETNVLTELINNVIDVKFEGIHTALPGRFETYDYKTGKATVKPLLKKVYLDGDVLELQVLTGVPVVFPRTNTAGMTFPIKKNDKCLILFAERSLENWYQTGNESTPGDPRRYSLADSVAIPGMYAFGEKVIQSNNDDVVIHNGDFKITIKGNGKISIKGASGFDLVSILDEWMTQMQQAKVITGIGLQPFDPTSLAAMLQIQNKLKSILE